LIFFFHSFLVAFYQSAFNFSNDFLLNLFEWSLPGITGRHNRNKNFEIPARVSQVFKDFSQNFVEDLIWILGRLVCFSFTVQLFL